MRSSLRLACLAALVSPTMAISAFAIDASAIKPHMEVVGMDGGHVGTVDKIEGDQMILTKTDKVAGGMVPKSAPRATAYSGRMLARAPPRPCATEIKVPHSRGVILVKAKDVWAGTDKEAASIRLN